jgi:hypothetical protein
MYFGHTGSLSPAIEIGEGGMGEVRLTEQNRRRVARKLIKAGAPKMSGHSTRSIIFSIASSRRGGGAERIA